MEKLQFIKDFIAIPIFIAIALTPEINESRELLCLFFAFGCLLDTLFTCYMYIYDYPWTIARVKDGLGATGMWVFTIAIAWANPPKESPHRWPIFFCFAAAIDTCSILSVFSAKYNLYTFILVPETLS